MDLKNAGRIFSVNNRIVLFERNKTRKCYSVKINNFTSLKLSF